MMNNTESWGLPSAVLLNKEVGEGQCLIWRNEQMERGVRAMALHLYSGASHFNRVLLPDVYGREWRRV